MRSTLINRWSITSLIGLVSITLVIIVLSTSYSSLVGNLSSVHASPATWQDDFNGKSLNTNIWSISTGTYGMGAQKNQHQGYFQRDRVSVNSGYLTLRLTQEYGRVGTNPHGIISRGGEISTLKTYGYGTYENKLNCVFSCKYTWKSC